MGVTTDARVERGGEEGEREEWMDWSGLSRGENGEVMREYSGLRTVDLCAGGESWIECG